MSILVEAIYERGVLRPLGPLDLAEGAKVAVLLVEPTSETGLNDILPVVNVLPLTSRKPGRRVYPICFRR